MAKLGFHIDLSNEYSNQLDTIASVKPAVVVALLNPNEPGKYTAQLSQVPTLLIRHFQGEMAMSGSDVGDFNPAANVAKAIRLYEPYLAVFPRAYWVYFRNEIGDWSKVDQYVAEMNLWQNSLAALGYRAAVGNFSFGTPDYPVWPKLAALLSETQRLGNCLNIHEYGVHTMKSLYNAQTQDGDHCLRYRKVWGLNSYASRYPNLKIVVGETGLDYGPAGTGGPYKTIGKSPAAYVEELKWYDSEISRDNGGSRPNVLGAAIYQWGRDPRWEAYDIQGGVANAIVAHIRSGVTPVQPEICPRPRLTPPLPMSPASGYRCACPTR